MSLFTTCSLSFRTWSPTPETASCSVELHVTRFVGNCIRKQKDTLMQNQTPKEPHAAQDVRQGEIVLKRRRQRVIFILALITAGVLAIAIASMSVN